MLNEDYITKLLRIKDAIEIKVDNETEAEAEVIHVHFKLKHKEHQCPRCKAMTSALHDYAERKINDVPGCANIVCTICQEDIDVKIAEKDSQKAMISRKKIIAIQIG